MGKAFGIAVFSFCACLCALGAAATWHVDDSASPPGDGASWATAFTTIQQGIDSASDGDTVLVAEGTYVENIRFNGKNIVLRSTDPLNPAIVANTIIDGNGAGSAVTFAGTEDECCTLFGFTVTNGRAPTGSGICGGAGELRARATVKNNIIVQNPKHVWGDKGGGIARCDGEISNNTISGNVAETGGGLYECGGAIHDNLIFGNGAAMSGGGLYNCDGVIRNNAICRNVTSWEGGALCACDGTILNNLISNNSAEYGGGLASCYGVVQSNTVAGNVSDRYGAGFAFCGASIHNCIVWANTVDGSPSQWYESSSPFFCCVQDWDGGGIGNISDDPLFADADGGDDDPDTFEDNDYRVLAESPCVDNGENYYWLAWPQRDLDGNCRLVGHRIDIGCYEYGSSPDLDGDLVCDAAESELGTKRGREDTDGDGLGDGLEVLRGTSPREPTPPTVIRVPEDFPGIQQALCLAASGDEIIVAPGTYPGNVHLCGVDVVLRSSDPADPGVVSSTILDGEGHGVVVRFTGAETQACVISGFTIRNGTGYDGGGIQGGTKAKHTRATIENNFVTGNRAGCDGGGLAFCDGNVRNNVISANFAACNGAGLAHCHGIIQGNTISENDGKGLYRCDGTVQNNVVSRNSNGGLFECNGTIMNNTVRANSTGADGGGLCYCHSFIVNNLIVENSAWRGGGLALCHGTIQNNTIVANSAEEGPGVWACDGTIRYCVSWGNRIVPRVPSTARADPSPVHDPNAVAREAIGPGVEYPGFVDPEAGDYHLRPQSFFVDAALNDYVFVWPQRDLDGNCRLAGPRVDLGCYECGSSPDRDGDLLCDSDEAAQGSDPEADDTDGDGLRDGLEILRGTNLLVPTSPETVVVPSEVSSIQMSLCLAIDGDEIHVLPGTYSENLQFCGAEVILRSTNPTNPDVVASTVIDGRQRGPVISFLGREGSACLLTGLTIRNGSGYYGGGILGGNAALRTLARIENNVITQNYSEETDGDGVIYCDGIIRHNMIIDNKGGGVSECHGVIERNDISGNWDWGLRRCHGTIQRNTITKNKRGGLLECHGTILFNTISRNETWYSGGGLGACNGQIAANTITANLARTGSGGGLSACNGIIENNLIAGNSAKWNGGGLSDCAGTVRNNTICHNRAGCSCGALYGWTAVIRNCIIWGNTGGSSGQLDPWAPVAYSCVQDWTSGENNISDAPLFVAPGEWHDPETPDYPDDDLWTDGDYRLRPDSPCIDVGDSAALSFPGLDLDGNLRIAFGRISPTVDMGAYEYKSASFRVSGLRADGGLQLIWDSQPNQSYTVWSCSALLTGQWAPEAVVPSQGAITWWTDVSLLDAAKFYRIEMTGSQR